jgi:hypothetical protein
VKELDEMFLPRRLQALKTYPGTNNIPAVIIAVKNTDSKGALEKAKAEYRAAHPGWLRNVCFLLWVNSQEAKDALSQTIAKLGER